MTGEVYVLGLSVWMEVGGGARGTGVHVGGAGGGVGVGVAGCGGGGVLSWRHQGGILIDLPGDTNGYLP